LHGFFVHACTVQDKSIDQQIVPLYKDNKFDISTIYSILLFKGSVLCMHLYNSCKLCLHSTIILPSNSSCRYS